MANPTSFAWSLLDRLGTVAQVQAYVNYASDTVVPDDLAAAWVATGALIDAATSSQITGGQVLIPMTAAGGWKSAPASSGNKNQEVINVNFDNAANQYATEFLLPAYLDAMISNGKVLLTQTQLAALIANLLSTAGAVDYATRDLQQITAVRDAFLTGRKRRNQRLLTKTLG